jgi:hypothetical protein
VGIGPSGVTGGKTLLVAGAAESSVEVGPGEAAAGSAPVVSAEPGPEVRSAQDPSIKTALTRAKLRGARFIMRQYRFR